MKEWNSRKRVKKCMDKKKFLEGLTGMSTKEYLHLLISDYKKEMELEDDASREKRDSSQKTKRHKRQ